MQVTQCLHATQMCVCVPCDRKAIGMACSSLCWGWIVRDESGDLWPGQSLMMKPSLCSSNYLTVLLSAVFISSHNYNITHCVIQPQPVL